MECVMNEAPRRVYNPAADKRRRTPEEAAEFTRQLKLMFAEFDDVNKKYPLPRGALPWVDAYEDEMREKQRNGQ